MKTIRAIEPNAGLTKSFERKVKRLKSRMVDEILAEMLKHLMDKGFLTLSLAQDDSLTNPKNETEKQKLDKIFKQISASILNREGTTQELKFFVKMSLSGWLDKYTKNAEQIATWFVKQSAIQTAVAQKAALSPVGIGKDILSKVWTVPVVKGQNISVQAAEALPKIVEDITNLVTNLGTEEMGRLQDLLIQSIDEGQDLELLKRKLWSFKNFDGARVHLVAMDQTNKLNFLIQRENSKALGMNKGIWVHVPGKYTSRETHKCPHTQRTKKGFKGLNGAVFDLDKGIYDEAVQRYVWPSSEVACRCIYKAVLPDFLKEFQ